ncbi:MAG: hypothetical protein GXP49_03490, partial [Deltaproteobacteria bacterium]|nr:hypothetical protein [Deltaproteobacteria bacterium]
MRVQCPNCKSIYELDEARFANVPEVKCSQCGALIVLNQTEDASAGENGGEKGKTMFMPAMSTAAKQIGDTPGAPS